MDIDKNFLDSKFLDVIYALYLTILPFVWSGYLIGNKMFNIKVVQVDRAKITITNMLLREIVGRFLLGIASFGITHIVSFLMIIFRTDKRSIHDLIGSTMVIQSEKRMHYSTKEEVLKGERETILI